MSDSKSHDRYTLPALPYDYAALEPHVDEATMRVHHLGHHQTYTNGLNQTLNAMAEAGHADLANTDIHELLTRLEDVPEAFRAKIRNQGGGYVNHNLFWKSMGPGVSREPTGDLATAINATFGSFSGFKEKFSTTAATVFGSGYAWLYLDTTSKPHSLKIGGSANQETPGNNAKFIPLLTLDVWEHAYYLKFQNKRQAYIDNWWNVVSWKNAEAIFDAHK